MFYSHTFLARKGPLGTVWCAAHLHHKLRKSHYISTNVSSTVEKIMNPEVPIALRMSGHLLLGVVRIHSKQVDYFFEDCNEIWITINRAFTTVSVNLPNDATQAAFHSVTLPEKFNLDNLELDDYNMDWCEDSHLKSRDEITLTEQIPTGRDPYIVINFDENDFRASSLMEEASRSEPTPMEEDDRPHVTSNASPVGFKSPSPSNNLGGDGIRTPRNQPSIEIMRDAQHGFDFNNSPILPDRADPDKFLEDQINKDMHTPLREEEGEVLPDPHFSSTNHHEEEKQHSFGRVDSEIPFASRSLEFEIQPTPEINIQPTPPVAKPKATRKRKLLYDTSTVLSNGFVRDTLDDTSDILRDRKTCPLSSLAIWKRNNKRRLKKEGLFVESFITGCCADLQGEDFSTHHLVSTEETQQETNVGQPPLSRHDSNIEIEILRDNERASASPERFMPPCSTPVPSPMARSHFTPENSNLNLGSEHFERTDGDETLPASDVGASRNLDSEMRTPDTFRENDMQFDNTGLSDIPELVPSAGDLGFLDEDDNSPAGTPEIVIRTTPQLHTLPSRTRAVAQYLKKQSVTPTISKESSEDLSLKKILVDKPTKICARMFYETLVLKNYGLVDVHQEKPYDDILLKVTTKLSMEQFS